MKSKLRIGNGSGFWGDTPAAPTQLAEKGGLDYLTLDYLAEVTLSVLALARSKDETKGYATDFIDVLGRIAPILADRPGFRIITNAGGIHPDGCAQAAAETLRQAGLTGRRIGVVTGDGFLDQIDQRLADGFAFANQETGAPLETIRDRIISANVYLGAEPIVQALRQDASIVVTGRVTDPAMVLAPAIHEFGWSASDWDRLAAGTVAGHLVECGAQVTGGIFVDWPDIDDPGGIGYPIVELAGDGSCVVTKPPGTGGVVNALTVKEQLLYEIGDPRRYLTADVVADFTTLQVHEEGENRVRVSGAAGRPATDLYKASIIYHDGYTAAGQIVITGEKAAEKARRAGQSVLERLRQSGVEPAETNVDVIGAGACGRGLAADDTREVLLRIAVRDPDRRVVERFTREVACLVTAGPPGTTGYAEARGKVRRVFAYWPTLVPKTFIRPAVRVMEV